jgi:hypothetical protein
MLTFPDGMLSVAGASTRLHNFRVTTEFGDDVEAASRAKIAVIMKADVQGGSTAGQID